MEACGGNETTRRNFGKNTELPRIGVPRKSLDAYYVSLSDSPMEIKEFLDRSLGQLGVGYDLQSAEL